MADLHYMSEKFGEAVYHMAVVDAPLRQRVLDAYVGEARLAHTVAGGHPNAQASPELVARMEALNERVTDDGSFETSFQVMPDDEVRAIAEEIYDIHLSIRGEEDDLVERRRSGG